MILGDRYQLQEPIGRGAMATIYRGWDNHGERVVAVKMLRDILKRVHSDQDCLESVSKFVGRFQREAKMASDLQHPNIVQV